MKEPNLFIIGAPKCGTTSIFNALSKHSDIAPSSEKEPHFYSSDFYRPRRISMDRYISLFNGDKREKASYWMEGSTRYIYSDAALTQIRNNVSCPKIIAVLRNPADLLFSLHNHLVFLGVEKEKELIKAWRQSLSFNRQALIDAGNTDPDSLNYPIMGMLGHRISMLEKLYDPEDVFYVFYDDLLNDPGRVLEGLLKFLSLEPESATRIGHDNKAPVRRSELVFSLCRLVGRAKKAAGIEVRFGVLSYVNKLNRGVKKEHSMRDEDRREILSYFKEDVCLLEELVGRRLLEWRS